MTFRSAVESQREYKIYKLNLTKVMMSLSNVRLTQINTLSSPAGHQTHKPNQIHEPNYKGLNTTLTDTTLQ